MVSFLFAGGPILRTIFHLSFFHLRRDRFTVVRIIQYEPDSSNGYNSIVPRQRSSRAHPRQFAHGPPREHSDDSVLCASPRDLFGGRYSNNPTVKEPLYGAQFTEVLHFRFFIN